MVKVGDIVPRSSGTSHLGVDGSGPASAPSFDITSIAPFGHVHQNSGIFHDPMLGQSGVIRFSLADASFQTSVNGGRTFSNLRTSESGVVGVNGAVVSQVDGEHVVDVASLSGLITAHDGSGLNAINGDVGPNIDIVGVNGAVITNPTAGQILVDVASISGIGGGGGGVVGSSQYSASFAGITSGIFTHNLNTRDVTVQVRDNSLPPRQIIPDSIIYDDLDNVSLLFNAPQTGRIVIVGSGISCSLSQNQIIDCRRYSLLIS